MDHQTGKDLIGCAIIAGLVAWITFGPCECKAAEFGPATDASGNVYPSYCPESIVDVPEYRTWITYEDLGPLNRLQGGGGLGGDTKHRWVNDETIPGRAPRLRAVPMIRINSRLSGWYKRDTERHEICHGLDVIAGRDNWHPHQSDFIPHEHGPVVRCADVFHC